MTLNFWKTWSNLIYYKEAGNSLVVPVTNRIAKTSKQLINTTNELSEV